eukprot:TRINITY_DN9932_c0_g1_i1.p1 TRINITY_DN9932_c0_g1~~TRINITY_DN9932_c0_g1_i1.p1  ORF type:complete len:302 (+),score=29.16 TRINITY_DN9932_c0_g1_i1:53-958(+)
MDCSTPLVCGICFESFNVVSIGEHRTGNGDVLRKDCGHAFCEGCLGSYVLHRIDEQRVFDIRCPQHGCSSQLFEADVQRLVSEQIFLKYSALLKSDFRTRLEHLMETSTRDHIETLLTIHNDSRLCPRCGVIIQRSQGCNSMYCFCGMHFNYGSAASVGGGGFGSIARLAIDKGLSLSESQLYGGSAARYGRAVKLAGVAGLTVPEADALAQRAVGGDAGAQAEIARLRQAYIPETCATASGFDMCPSPSKVKMLRTAAAALLAVVRLKQHTKCAQPKLPSRASTCPMVDGQLQRSASMTA